MLHSQTFTCVKCGKSFTKMVGGVVMTPKERELMTRPVCDKCKFNAIRRNV